VSFGARVESIQAMRRARWILVVCPGFRVDVYGTMGERNDEGETKKEMNGKRIDRSGS
jgi:hypothetical protein